MSDKNTRLAPEDYTDPQCPFCVDGYLAQPPVHPIPTGRVIEKLDSYLGKNDYAGAERHLLYWLAEATEKRDERGQYTVHNELMGLYRKTGRKQQALEHAQAALAIADRLGLSSRADGATALVNVATVYKTFGESQSAMRYFEQARPIYERELGQDDEKLGGLYNNMALALCDLGRYDEARELYDRAMQVMARVEHGQAEIAITLLNLATLSEAQYGLEDDRAQKEISDCLDRAYDLLCSPELPRNGYHAFVCEKCAPTYGHYGYFFIEQELSERARRIYEGA